MKYYFVGIKGSGMSSLATILFDLGNEVTGYDDDSKHKYTEDALIERGIKIYYDQSFDIKDNVVVYSPAVKMDHGELVRARELGLTCLEYNKMLGELTKQYNTIAICGCHGKTTTTSLLSHVLDHIIGTNYLIGDGTGHADKDSEYFVIEACEYRRHFLDYYPKYTIMTNIELDHVDYYKDLEDVKDAYQSFANQTEDLVIACGDDKNIRSININKKVIYYGFNENNDIVAKNVTLNSDGSSFDLYINNEFKDHFDIHLYGNHMVLNTLAVITLTYNLGIDLMKVKEYIQTFRGAKRRFKEKVFGDIITIDDYAHHSTEIRVTIESARQKYPDKEIVAIYLPNTYSRTKLFYEEEAAALNKADKIYVMDIKADREKQEDYQGVTSDLIINLLHNGEKISIEEVNKLLQHKNSVLIFMSCTSIYHIQNEYERLLTEKNY
jgi:UDP-N-acetylmuramate--alanine ligase